MDKPDEALIEQCLRGDNAAFGLLVIRHQTAVVRFCSRMLGDADDGADAAQDTFLKAYHALDRFRNDCPFLPWLLRIASNTCIDRRRRARPERHLDDLSEGGALLPAPGRTPEQRAMERETARMVRETVLTLPANHRAVVTLFYYGGLSVSEISQATGRPQGTVKSDLHHAREILRRKLEGVAVTV